MNICIESSILNHNRRSGLMTYTEGLVYSLFENDSLNDYTLAYYSLRRKPQDMPGPFERNFQKHVLRVPDREFFKRQFFIDSVVLPRFFKSQKIQIFHRPSGYTMPSVKNVFKVLTIHDLRTLTIQDKFWKQNIPNYKKALNALNMCVVVSECTKQDLIKHFDMDPAKIKVIYLGADKRFCQLEPKTVDAVKAKYNIREPFLLSIGSVPRKNIEGIIRGFAASNASQKFILVLSCNMDIDKYQQIAQNEGVEKRIQFLSSLNDAEVIALYNGCRCFVFPSLYEGFGLPILEAMQCQTPVITSNVSSCPEVAGDAAILVDPSNIRQIASAIDQVCTDDVLRKQLIEKGLKRAKCFGWDQFAQEMKKVYALA
ncbi:MAG: glycosyltransferase family 4 protein [Candidatus Omnitrophica bacterium]|nr:glycosyltransferase family 4 protein [Candidatus Omnitrophota bacterium]